MSDDDDREVRTQAKELNRKALDHLHDLERSDPAAAVALVKEGLQLMENVASTRLNVGVTHFLLCTMAKAMIACGAWDQVVAIVDATLQQAQEEAVDDGDGSIIMWTNEILLLQARAQARFHLEDFIGAEEDLERMLLLERDPKQREAIVGLQEMFEKEKVAVLAKKNSDE